MPADRPLRDTTSLSQEVDSGAVRCGTVVGHYRGRDLVCDLPLGHQESTPCHVPVKDIKEINVRVIEQFRAGGQVDDFDRDGLILLTTVGSRSGQPRTSPMAFYEEGNRLVVVANNQGGAKHPDWYVNLVADQRVTVEVGGQTYPAVAVELQGEERERVWDRLRILNPYLAQCQARVSRTLPIIALTRV